MHKLINVGKNINQFFLNIKITIHIYTNMDNIAESKESSKQSTQDLDTNSITSNEDVNRINKPLLDKNDKNKICTNCSFYIFELVCGLLCCLKV